MIDIVEILIHWHAGRPKAEIAHSLGVDRKTVRKYVAAAEAAGITTGGQPLSHEQWAARTREWFPELLAPELRCPSFAELGRFHDTIKAGLQTNTASTVWQRLRDEERLEASLASFRRCIHAVMPEEAERSAVTHRQRRPATRRGGPDRLRLPGPLDRPGDRTCAAGVGVRDGPGRQPAHVRPTRCWR